jgi:hypothetical protein
MQTEKDNTPDTGDIVDCILNALELARKEHDLSAEGISPETEEEEEAES